MRISRIILAALGIILLIVFLIWVFSGGSPKKPQTQRTNPIKSLPDYADTNSEVSLTKDGIVNGDDIHRTIRITVNSTSRKLDIIQGYSGNVINSNTFSNTLDAYTVFLKAINTAGFLSKRASPGVPTNPDGQCPLGFRYIYNLTEDGKDIFSAWSSTCGSDSGTSAGSTSSLLTLFQNQITNYSDLTEDVNLSATTTPTNQ